MNCAAIVCITTTTVGESSICIIIGLHKSEASFATSNAIYIRSSSMRCLYSVGSSLLVTSSIIMGGLLGTDFSMTYFDAFSTSITSTSSIDLTTTYSIFCPSFCFSIASPSLFNFSAFSSTLSSSLARDFVLSPKMTFHFCLVY